MASATKADALDALFANAEKKYGSPVGTLDNIGSDARFISTGNMSFDIALGGGFPLGRLVELAGPPSCGKTTLAAMAVANLQKKILAGGDEALGIKPDDVILYLDFENAVDKSYMHKLGIDTRDSSLRFTQPDFLEDGAQLIKDVIPTGRVRMIVVDSVAQMMPRDLAEADVGKSLPAIVAKILTPWGITVAGLAAKHDTLVIFINHEKEVMSMGGRPGAAPVTSTPGGVALKYAQSQRLSFRQVQKNYVKVKDEATRAEENRVTSIDIVMQVVKNKVAPPFRKARARVRENRGFDNFWSAATILMAHRLIMAEAGGMFFFHRLEEAGLAEPWMAMSAPKAKTPARPYIRGLENVYLAADTHPEWRQKVIDYTVEHLGELLGGDEDDAAEAEQDFVADEPDPNADATALLDSVVDETGKRAIS